MFSHVDPTLSLEKLRTNIEGQFFDRKSARIQAQDFAHHLSAFANASGGLVVIGIEDNGFVIQYITLSNKWGAVHFGLPCLSFFLWPILQQASLDCFGSPA